jgi:hypothetical protein
MRTSADIIRRVRDETLQIEKARSVQAAYDYLLNAVDSFEENSDGDQKEIDVATMMIGKMILNIKKIEGVF